MKNNSVYQQSYRSLDGYRAMMSWYDRSLAHLPFEHESCMLPTSFGPTHVLISGLRNFENLVLLPGWGGNAVAYKTLIQELSTSFRVYAIDPIGFTGKSSPARPSVEGSGYGQWLLEVMEQSQIDKACFVGVSGGSWILLKLASIAPDRIRCSTLVNPLGFVPLRFPYRLSHARHAPYLVNLFAYTFGNDERLMNLLFKLPASPSHEAKSEAMLLFKHFRIFLPPKPIRDAEQRKLDSPTIILVGEKERLYSKRSLTEQARRTLPRLLYTKVIPNVGHYIHRECPETIALHSKFLIGTLAG